MTNVERMRAKQRQFHEKMSESPPSQPKPQVRPPAPPKPGRPVAAPAPAAATPPPKPKPPAVSTEPVTCTCGHVAQFELFADPQDKFREARRKKLAGRPCPQCRIEAEKQRVAQAKAAKANKPKCRPGGMHDRRMNDKGRLPDGAQFVVIYNADFQSWGGHLLIGTKRFVGQAGGVFKLLSQLDDQYRKFLAQEANSNAG